MECEDGWEWDGMADDDMEANDMRNTEIQYPNYCFSTKSTRKISH